MNLLIKPASGACNMRCRYCFYEDEMQHRKVGLMGMMSHEILETVVRKSLETATVECNFMFQGGEPTLVGLDFYRALIGFVKKHNVHRLHVGFSIQTNGYDVGTDWVKFFAANHFLVGLSLDGPREFHNAVRVDTAGKGSYDRILHTVSLLNKYNVEYNVLSVVTGTSARSASRIFRFFADHGFAFQQYIPCLDPLEGEKCEWSLTSERYGDFLCRIFDEWYASILAGKYVYHRTFENWMTILLGGIPENCGMSGICSPQYVVEADGSVYPCDFYVLDEYRLGNLVTDGFETLDQRREKLRFIEASKVLHPDCNSCEWLALCRGGCRRERVPDPNAPDLPPKHRFCEAFRRFFPYAADRLADAARRLYYRNLYAKYGQNGGGHKSGLGKNRF